MWCPEQYSIINSVQRDTSWINENANWKDTKIMSVLIFVVITGIMVNFNFRCDETIKNKYSSPCMRL